MGTKIRGKQLENNTVKQNNFDVSVNSITYNSAITNKQFIEEYINSKVSEVNYSLLNQNMNALTTSGSTPSLACDKYIIEYPMSDVMVTVNGIKANIGGNVAPYDGFFTPDSGTTIRAYGEEQKGDYLYWNNLEFELDPVDKIDFIYLVNYHYVEAIENQIYTFNQLYDNTVIRFTGDSGTTSTLIISATTYIFGNVGGQFVFDIGGANEHTFTYVGEKIEINGNNIIWDGFGSLVFSVEKTNKKVTTINTPFIKISNSFLYGYITTSDYATYTINYGDNSSDVKNSDYVNHVYTDGIIQHTITFKNSSKIRGLQLVNDNYMYNNQIVDIDISGMTSLNFIDISTYTNYGVTVTMLDNILTILDTNGLWYGSANLYIQGVIPSNTTAIASLQNKGWSVNYYGIV